VWQYECSAVIDELTVNVALVTAVGGTGIDPVDPILVFDRDSQAVQVFEPGIDVIKRAFPTQLVGSGEVTYTYEVTNVGDVPLADVEERITDDTCAPVEFLTGDDDADGLLDSPNSIFEDAADERWFFRCTTTVSEDTTNVVDVIGTPTDPGGVDLCGPESSDLRVDAPCDVTDSDRAVVEVLEPATIVIEKVAFPVDSDQAFEFDVTGQDGVSVQGGESATITPLAPGTYTVTETVPDDWALYDISCTDPTGDTTISIGSESADIALNEGETVTCTFVNVIPPGIVIEKSIDGGDPDESFSFASELLGDFGLSGGESVTFSDLRPGDYTVSESPRQDWELTGLVCDGGDTVTDLAAGQVVIELQLAEIVTCTFTNSPVEPPEPPEPPRPPEPPQPPEPPEPPTTTNPVIQLPATGSDGPQTILVGGTAALLLGLGAMLFARRRRITPGN
jgi:LPXTG-motif cell wall-anchored protein